MNDTVGLSLQKQEKISGGNVNYYLHRIPATADHPAFDVEMEDIIEIFDMTFSQGTSFGSLVRKCKIKMGLNKPGSSEKYESEKVDYYNIRVDAVTKRRLTAMSVFSKAKAVLNRITNNHLIVNLDDLYAYEVTIKDPRRLPPYTFIIGELIDALQPSPLERAVFENIFQVALLRSATQKFRPFGMEEEYTQRGKLLAAELKRQYQNET